MSKRHIRLDVDAKGLDHDKPHHTIKKGTLHHDIAVTDSPGPEIAPEAVTESTIRPTEATAKEPAGDADASGVTEVQQPELAMPGLRKKQKKQKEISADDQQVE